MRTHTSLLLPSLGLLSLVACNEAPSAPTIALQPGEPTTTDDLVVQFLSLSTDGDAKDEVTHRFTWFVDGDARDDLTTDTVPASETTKGQTWKVVVIPNDGTVDGPSAEASVTVANTVPVATLTLAPAAPATDADLVATATATDLDEDAVTFSYAWTRDGQPTEQTGATVPASATAHGETWEVTAIPNDGEADGEAVTASLTIANTAPALTGVTLVPDLPYANETIVAVVAGVTDADDDSVALTYRWRVNGTIVAEGPDAELPPGAFAKHDSVTVEVVPNDGFVDGASLTSDPALVQNSVPMGLSVSVTPAEAYEASTLTCAPLGWSDVDGDPEGWSFSWEVNGAAVAAGATLTGASFDKGDVVTCRGVPQDGEESGAELVASAVTVRNTAPILASATLSTTAPREADTISVALGAGADDDGDTITYGYAWSVNGSTVATTPTLTGARFGRGDRISVTVTPYDGETAGTPVTTSEAVGANSPPALGAVSLMPGTLRTNDLATASVSASDPDGDAVTLSYAWTVDGVPVASAASSLDGAVWFDKGQAVRVTVTPDDGADVGTAVASASVTVANSAPSAPVVSIDPSEATASDDLVCGIDTASADPDGDTVSYTFAWDRDGTAYTGATRTLYAGDTVPASATSDGETWTCEVVATDGTESSGVGSAAANLCESMTGVTFDAASDTIVLGTGGSVTFGSTGTIEAWVYYAGTPGIIYNQWVSAREDVWFGVDSEGKPAGSLFNGSYGGATSAVALSRGRWQHVAFTWDGSVARVFLDGVLTGGQAYTGTPRSVLADGRIGAMYRDGRWDSPMYGTISQVRISDRAVYTSAFTPNTTLTVESATRRLYRLDEGSGTTIHDASGSVTGTLSGAAWTVGLGCY